MTSFVASVIAGSGSFVACPLDRGFVMVVFHFIKVIKYIRRGELIIV
jgi:hypothetical protein